MPVIACPGCGKQYKIAATAAGQVAKCACGKRFRLGSAKPSPAAAVGAALAQKQKPAPAKAVAAAVAPSAVKDDFWDDSLAIADKPKPPAPSPDKANAAAQTASRAGSKSAASATSDAKPKKKRKKSSGVRWGFDWGKVVGGLASFAIFGGLTVAIVMSTGRVSRGTIYLAVPAIAGLFTAINGLMGEEGIW